MIEGKRLAINATYRQVSIIVFLVIAGMLIPSLMLPWGERSIFRISTVAGLVIGFFPSLLHPSFLWSDAPYTVTVESSGIRSLDPQRRSPYLPWSEITAIKDIPHAATVELHGPPGFRPLRLAYQLEHFPELIQLLLQKVPQEHISPSFPLSFQKNLSFLHMLLPCLLTMGAFFFEYVKQEDSFFLVLLLGIAGALLIAFLASMQRLESRTSGLLIWKWPRKRTIPFYEIEAVHLISKENEYSGIPSFDIRATLVTKQKVSLLPDGCDAFAVYYAAKIGLDRYKTQPSQKVE